jgi:Fis family transcriptional regulator
MNGHGSGHLHDLVITGVEKPLVEMVLKETNGNQTQAANILGINRNTLRKKIQEYSL